MERDRTNSLTDNLIAAKVRQKLATKVLGSDRKGAIVATTPAADNGAYKPMMSYATMVPEASVGSMLLYSCLLYEALGASKANLNISAIRQPKQVVHSADTILDFAESEIPDKVSSFSEFKVIDVARPDSKISSMSISALEAAINTDLTSAIVSHQRFPKSFDKTNDLSLVNFSENERFVENVEVKTAFEKSQVINSAETEVIKKDGIATESVVSCPSVATTVLCNGLEDLTQIGISSSLQISEPLPKSSLSNAVLPVGAIRFRKSIAAGRTSISSEDNTPGAPEPSRIGIINETFNKLVQKKESEIAGYLRRVKICGSSISSPVLYYYKINEDQITYFRNAELLDSPVGALSIKSITDVEIVKGDCFHITKGDELWKLFVPNDSPLTAIDWVNALNANQYLEGEIRAKTAEQISRSSRPASDKYAVKTLPENSSIQAAAPMNGLPPNSLEYVKMEETLKSYAIFLFHFI